MSLDFKYLDNNVPSPLPRSQQRELLDKFRESGDKDILEKLVTHNLRLVWHIVHRFGRSKEDVEDIFGWGVLGLVTAIRKYKSELGEFSTYAVPFIRGSIQRFKRDGSILHIRRSDTLIARRVFGAEDALMQRTCRASIADGEIASELGISRETVQLVRAGHATIKSLDEPASDFDDRASLDLISSGGDVEEDATNRVDNLAMIGRIKRILTKREYQVLAWRLGLDGGKELTQVEIAHRVGKSQAHVSRLELQALEKLRKAFGVVGVEGRLATVVGGRKKREVSSKVPVEYKVGLLPSAGGVMRLFITRKEVEGSEVSAEFQQIAHLIMSERCYNITVLVEEVDTPDGKRE